MAKKSTLPDVEEDVKNDDIDDSNFDVPEDINEENDEPTVPHSVLNAKINKARDAISRKKLYPPQGDWKKVDKWDGREVTFEQDKSPDDLNPNGRTMLMVYGKPEERISNTGEPFSIPTLQVRCSPDVRYDKKNPTEHDFMHKMFLKAERVFFELYQRDADFVQEIFDMLRDDSYFIVTGTGDDGLFVSGVKPIKNR